MAEVVEARTSFNSVATPNSPSRKRSASPPTGDESSATSALATTANTATTDLTATTEPPTKKTKLIRRKRRPARPQIDPSALKDSTSGPPPQTGTVFNIWYNKWAGGDREDAALSKTAAINRCHIKEDAGWTAADKVSGSYFCLFFARGICPKGHECQYLHRLPGMFDHFNPNVDVFGRDKHSDYRDDMGGVGSFLRQNRTLYVGRIHVTDDIEEIVARHFAEWGEVERIRVLTGRGVGFITYVHEGNAQFAKEAMAHQALDNGEILNVRWATVDPNPLSQKREAQRIEEQAAEAVRKALGEKAVRQIEGRESREEIAQRRIESGFGLEGYEAPDDVWYNAQKQREIEGQQLGERRLLHDGPAGVSSADGQPQPQPQPQQEQEQQHQHQQQQQQERNELQRNSDPTQISNYNSNGPTSAQEQSTRSNTGSASGFFGASTLAALKARNGMSSHLQGAIPANPTAASAAAASASSSAGPLVGYGSDSDDER